MLNEQNALGTSEGCTNFLKMIIDEDFRNDVAKIFKEYTSSLDRWRAFKTLADFTVKQVNNSRRSILNLNFISNLCNIFAESQTSIKIYR